MRCAELIARYWWTRTNTMTLTTSLHANLTAQSSAFMTQVDQAVDLILVHHFLHRPQLWKKNYWLILARTTFADVLCMMTIFYQLHNYNGHS